MASSSVPTPQVNFALTAWLDTISDARVAITRLSMEVVLREPDARYYLETFRSSLIELVCVIGSSSTPSWIKDALWPRGTVKFDRTSARPLRPNIAEDPLILEYIRATDETAIVERLCGAYPIASVPGSVQGWGTQSGKIVPQSTCVWTVRYRLRPVLWTQVPTYRK